MPQHFSFSRNVMLVLEGMQPLCWTWISAINNVGRMWQWEGYLLPQDVWGITLRNLNRLFGSPQNTAHSPTSYIHQLSISTTDHSVILWCPWSYQCYRINYSFVYFRWSGRSLALHSTELCWVKMYTVYIFSYYLICLITDLFTLIIALLQPMLCIHVYCLWIH